MSAMHVGLVKMDQQGSVRARNNNNNGNGMFPGAKRWRSAGCSSSSSRRHFISPEGRCSNTQSSTS